MKIERGTGKTQRMLEHVKNLTDEGSYVFVLAASHAHSIMLQIRFAQMTNGQMAGTKVYPPEGGQASFQPIDEKLDLASGRMYPAHRSCKVVADHFALETRFRWIYDELSRYDNDNPYIKEPTS